MDTYQSISQELTIPKDQVGAVADLLESGATIPFIARYRKELTGSLDEVALAAIRDSLSRFAELEKRRAAITSSLKERNLLDKALHESLEKALSLRELEDLYLPYRPKRRTRAMIARERGLEELAELLLQQGKKPVVAESFLNPERNIGTIDEAWGGARDIVAEKLSEDQHTRARLRSLFKNQAVVRSRLIEKKRHEAAKFRDYFDWQEPVARLVGHRLLAMLRGESAGMLHVSIRPEEQKAVDLLCRLHLKESPVKNHMLLAIQDGYKRLLAPSLENEIRGDLKDKADAEAIGVFAKNLRELLLAPPLGQKRVLSLDPGFRTGAKLVCLDAQGQLLHSDTIYPTQGEKQRLKAEQTVRNLVSKFRIEAIAIGNGTAGRETEQFIRELKLDPEFVITLVNEDGASIYSASETARAEFPDQDITVRGAVSIGRRLQDPLAELVKIDPKSIGVGQYQHDVNQNQLKAGLDDVVSSCVNSVGVELNTASVNLLTYVSGLGPVLAANIVSYRNENGPFSSRRELMKVPRLGARAFEQAAGFLRIRSGSNPLDRSAVHPERYDLVQKMAADVNTTIESLIASESDRKRISLENYISDAVGLPTLRDIISELARPGRDPRPQFRQFSFEEGINRIDDLRPGMIVPAIITNVTKFGAFADVGVHQDGLIHISQLADRFVKDPSEIVRVRQQVMVRILEVDLERKRISLSLRKTEHSIS